MAGNVKSRFDNSNVMRLKSFIITLIDEITRDKEIPVGFLCESMEACLNDNLYERLNKQVRVTLLNGNIDIFVENGHLPVKLDVSQIPKKVILKIKHELPQYIKDVEDKAQFEYWKNFRGTVREGMVIRRRNGCYDIDLGNNQVGTLPLKFTTSHESYIPGKVMWFYISSVEKPCQIVLNRNTKHLPEAFLLEKMPWAKFQVISRWVGKLSIILTERPIPKDIIRSLSDEIGERVVIRIPRKKFSINEMQ